jgi:cation diffusion facilitator CzcD-associated flavoprotein CzcO
VQRVAIIGAGWSGLQIAAVFVERGDDVTLFEVLDDVGGTWHPAVAYADLSIHTPVFRSGFADFANFEGHSPLARVSSADVFENCRRFADAKGLRPRIRFRHAVTALDYDSTSQTTRLTVRNLDTGETSTVDADVVVSTQFNTPRVPDFAGRDAFGGDVLHANEVKAATIDRLVREGRRVVLLGGSKSATDLALAMMKRGCRFSWLMRRMYWFLSYDKGYWDVRRNRPSSPFYRWLYFVGLGLARNPRSNRFVFDLWKRAGLLQCPGQPHDDDTKFHHGWLDEQQLAALRERTEQTYGEVDRLEPGAVLLRDGRRLPCDTLVCATGCDPIGTPIALTADGRAVDYRAVEHVYRYSVIPELPRLVFTGYAMFGFGPLNGYHRAAWILRYLEQGWTTGALREAALRDGAASGTFMFKNGSFLFDSSTLLLLRFKQMNAQLSEGIYSAHDVKRHYFDIAVRHLHRPLEGVSRFLASRRRA